MGRSVMTHLNIVSGFLGAGKTTLLRKLIPHLSGKLALIENEFGKVGIDGTLLGEQIPKREVYAGCICCSIAKEFSVAVDEIIMEHRPDRLFIEPSGIGSLSEILKLCQRLTQNEALELTIDPCITLVDVSAYNDYIENFGYFYQDQIEHANVILLSYVNSLPESTLHQVIDAIRSLNPKAFLLNEDWLDMPDEVLLETLESAFETHSDGLLNQPLTHQHLKMPPFNSVAITNPHRYEKDTFNKALETLKSENFGCVLRAKGFVQLKNEGIAHFDYTPQHTQWQLITNDEKPRIVFIGTALNKTEIIKHFSMEEL